MDRYFEDCREGANTLIFVQKKPKSVGFQIATEYYDSKIRLSYEETKELIKHLQTLVEEENV